MKTLLREWFQQPEDSREVVLSELRTMASLWQESAGDENTTQDARTLRIAAELLTSLKDEP